MRNQHSLKQTVGHAIMAAITAVVLLALSFSVLEPTLSLAIVDDFTIRQQITDEISFTVPAADVTMAGAIQGITGGNATGSTQTVVRTNSAGGYTMDIAFSGAPAMRGDVSTSSSIRDYVGAEPSFTFTASSAALFAYTVTASSTTDLDPSFLNNGAACNTGSGSTVDRCWKGPAVTNFRIVNRNSSASGGATTTIKFIVNVPNNPSPALVQDFYTATATLTALNQ